MDKLVRNPIMVVGSICLMAFLFPGMLESFPNGGFRIGLGMIQPGWCTIIENPPVTSGLKPGVFFAGTSISWFLLCVFVLAIIVTSPKAATEEQDMQDEYRRTMRRPKYY